MDEYICCALWRSSLRDCGWRRRWQFVRLQGHYHMLWHSHAIVRGCNCWATLPQHGVHLQIYRLYVKEFSNSDLLLHSEKWLFSCHVSACHYFLTLGVSVGGHSIPQPTINQYFLLWLMLLKMTFIYCLAWYITLYAVHTTFLVSVFSGCHRWPPKDCICDP